MRALLLIAVLLLAPAPLLAQGRAAAPVDLTGYWVSVITDFWRYRMLTPPKGNVDYLPMTPEGRKAVDAWDPAKDEAAGEQCRGYGAVGVMRLPGRLHLTWESDDVLKLDADAGTQTRRFVFTGPPAVATAAATAPPAPSWQGTSTARWTRPVNPSAPGLAPQGELRVTTTRMRPGYLRKNGIPYSANATMNEYFVRLVDDAGQQYLAVTQMLEDQQYFLQPIVRTMLFKKQADGAGWNPTPCAAG